MSNDIFVSVLIPAKNEANNLKPLLEEVRVALADESYEIIVVDDGSTDATLHELQQAKNNGLSQLRILHHDRSLGQSTSLYHAAQAARGQWLATLDGDGQNDPADIPGMLALVRNPRGSGDLQLVAGHRVNRRDTASKRWASRFANGLRSRLLKDATPDTGCGLKLIQRAAFLRLPYFDHMHRYIPALIQRHNGRMVVHPVNHRHRTAGVSKYGNIDRALVGILDLFGVWWLIKRTRLNTRLGRFRNEPFPRILVVGGRLCRPARVHRPFRPAVAVQRIQKTQRDPDQLLVPEYRRQCPAADVCHLPAGPGVHCRPGFWLYCLSAQPATDCKKQKPQGVSHAQIVVAQGRMPGVDVARPAFGRCRSGPASSAERR
jgi:dolichol-phosphate mannosyltransferase